MKDDLKEFELTGAEQPSRSNARRWISHRPARNVQRLPYVRQFLFAARYLTATGVPTRCYPIIRGLTLSGWRGIYDRRLRLMIIAAGRCGWLY